MTSVSRETSAKFVVYKNLLLKWQNSINLVSPETLNKLESRHFADSRVVVPLINKKTVLDMGSGAGFPGMVIAIERPEITVTLIDADQRKCAFLKSVSRETQTPVTIINKRLEDAEAFYVEIITARALAPLKKLIKLSLPFIKLNMDIHLIFMKGRNWQEEVQEAEKEFSFKYEMINYASTSDGVILKLNTIYELG